MARVSATGWGGGMAIGQKQSSHKRPDTICGMRYSGVQKFKYLKDSKDLKVLKEIIPDVR